MPYQFFILNRVREGEQWLRYAREKFPNAVPADVSLAEFAITRATENARDQSQNKVTQLVQAFVAQSYLAVIGGSIDDANQYMLRAEELWNAYQKRSGGNQRTGLPPLNEIKRLVRDDMLAPDSGFSPEDKARLRTVVGGPAETPAAVPPKPQ